MRSDFVDAAFAAGVAATELALRMEDQTPITMFVLNTTKPYEDVDSLFPDKESSVHIHIDTKTKMVTLKENFDESLSKLVFQIIQENIEELGSIALDRFEDANKEVVQ